VRFKAQPNFETATHTPPRKPKSGLQSRQKTKMSMMKNLKTVTCYVLIFMLLAFASGCTKEDDGSGDGGTDITGVWQRYGSPKGYQTDLAIGNIPGEPSDRVYMCEHPGSPSAGLYKGTISGNTITWDAAHGLPNAVFNSIGNGERSLYFGVGAVSDAGKYRKGSWTNTCGELKKSGTGGGGNTAGYNCVSGSCSYVSSGATYSSLSACQSNCGGSGSAGYNCVSGNCNYVSSGATYSSLSACQSSCGSSGSAKGQFMAWTSVPEYGFPNNTNAMNISIYGKTGTIYGGYYTSAPSCGATYCFTGSLSPGQYTISGKIYFLKGLDGITPPPYSTSQSITIYANQCTKVHFQ
jgi:hypothetical protein